MKIAIIGFAVENKSVYRYLSQYENNEITICDKNEAVQIPENTLSQLGENYLDNLGRFDIIIRTVGMHPKIILENNPEVDNIITTAVNLFFEECHSPIIGVTGTKGKGTTSTLISKILEAAGKKVILAGNIGTPMLDVLDEANKSDLVVLELSSFQLCDVKYSPQIAVCLMVVPEHLNWHRDMQDYLHAKQNLFRYQKEGDITVHNALNANSASVAAVSPSLTKLTYFVGDEYTSKADAFVSGDSIWFKDTEICKISEVGLVGRHNLENICAAVAATFDLISGDVNAIRSVVLTFEGLPHRLELVRELDGVKYYDDSFSTTPETAIAAINSFDHPKILILGGSDKGVSFDELADEAAKSAKHILAIGVTGRVIAELLRERGFHKISQDGLDNMESIVGEARDLSKPGDVVILSTGSASFDMFKDYKDRGTQFQSAVKALK
ncbi:MAG: UDP-N-acetylmuramoyl-L-alanine--D-glutamate ligase [bacterium]|nr:UDP-N-acetylmuramoyl-L-alanine--D-glutamate ligase [bacterium]